MFHMNRVRLAALAIGLAALLVTLWISTGSRHGTQVVTETASDKSVVVRSVAIPVDGMICQVCVGRVKSMLKAVHGVEEAEISLEKRTAVIRYETGQVGVDRLTRAINELGYKAGVPTAIESR